MGVLRMIATGIFAILTGAFARADLVIEAENADQIQPPFQVFNNATASGGKVVAKPSGVSGQGKAVFKLNIPASGNYTLRARVYAADSSSNSFVVQLNSGTKTVWNLPVSDSWQLVTYPSALKLAAGTQMLTIYSKEADAVLDRIEIINQSTAPVSSPTPSPTPVVSNSIRGMWVWTTATVLSNSAEQETFFQLVQSTKITDVYLYLVKNDYQSKASVLRAFISRLSSVGIRAWGLEGYRGYFSDAYGPQDLYATIDALVSYNGSVQVNEQFVGFHSDMEPQDGQGSEFKTTFHNGLADSKLSTSSGGVWSSSQAQDRELLMRDWLNIHSTLSSKLRARALKFAASMPSWTDDYFGEEVKVTYNGVRQGVMKHMMPLLDQYIVMSYNTTPSNVANRAAGELTYADTLPVAQRPQVFAALETHAGAGTNVSYADTAPKNHRSSVLTDIDTIKSLLSNHPSFSGVDIHDWEGWRDLQP